MSMVGRRVRVSPAASASTAKRLIPPARSRRDEDQGRRVPVEYEALVPVEHPAVAGWVAVSGDGLCVPAAGVLGERQRAA